MRSCHSLTRRLMAQMEEDLGTKLDWVAVDHYNTGHPHTHIILRGKDDRGKDLIIAREYITHGMRERAAEIVSLDLGPRSDIEIEDRLRERRSSRSGSPASTANCSARRMNAWVRAIRLAAQMTHSTRACGRAGCKSSPGWAWPQEIAAGPMAARRRSWSRVLRRMGERGDIIRTMHREMTREGRARAPRGLCDLRSLRSQGTAASSAAWWRAGLSDEIKDRHYLIVDGIDGRSPLCRYRAQRDRP